MPNRLLLFAHGASIPSNHPWMERWAKNIDPLGRVVRFDFPYMQANIAAKAKEEAEGVSEKRPKMRGRPDELKDLVPQHRTVLGEARKEGEPAVLIGKSMGGRVSLHTSLDESMNVAAVICFAYPLMGGKRRQKSRRDNIFKDLKVPTLFIQGTMDRKCPVRSLEEALQVASAPTAIHRVEGGDHNLMVKKKRLEERNITQDDVDARVTEAITAFLDKHVAG